MNRFRSLLISGLVLLVCGAALTAGVWKIRTPTSVPLQLDGEMSGPRAYWQERVESVGAEKAYAEFEQKYVDSPPVAHVYAHILGDLMYGKVGLKAVAVCDDKFGYGCFHQVVSDILIDYGSNAIVQLNALCFSKSNKSRDNCYHGLGHGILDFFTPAHLTDALDGCTKMTERGGVTGCERGVFMEYNVPIPVDGSDPKLAVRPFDPKHPNSPCDSATIQDPYKRACYISLPQWWSQYVPTRAVAEMCHGVPASSQKTCVEGLSLDMPGRLQFDQEAIIKECDTIPDAVDRDLCLTASATMLQDFKRDACVIWKEVGQKSPQCS